MYKIELTQEQKDKLLEMCKVLFPDENIKFDKCEAFGDRGNEFLYGKTLDIHWYEFCMTYLMDKLFLPKGESRLDGIKFCLFYEDHENLHIIDCLYEQFLKLKTT